MPRVSGESHPFRPVTGEGVFHIPVGPVHAGIIEPGHFRFGVAGEPVLYLQLRLFYVHKGTEKRFERLPWRHGLFLAESISGDTAVGHALAYAHAIERLAGVAAPPRARALRVVLLELERIYNHTADIGAVATDVAFTVPASRAQALREGLVAHARSAVRHAAPARHDRARGRRGAISSAEGLEELRAHLRAFEQSVRRSDRAAHRRRHVHRSRGRHRYLSPLRRRATWGPSAWRRARPGWTWTSAATIRSTAYEGLRFDVPVEEGGDVRARLMIRAREVEQSLSIVGQVLDALPGLPLPGGASRATARLVVGARLGGSVAGAVHALDRHRRARARSRASRSPTRAF